jgi:hypothetical protein
MKLIRLFLLLFTFGFAPLSIGAEAGLGDRLVGVWREYHPSTNVVQFFRDGTTKLYLKKGEIRDLRSLDGKWVISDFGMLAITYAVGDKTLTLEARVSFDNEEMILTEKNGDQTKHRKHVGPIPQVYVW